MQHCPKCRIDIIGDKRCCPLCKGDLTGTPEQDVFPVIGSRTGHGYLVKITSFIAAAVLVVMLAIIYLTEMSWPAVVMILTVVGWIDILLVFYYRYNALKLITLEVCAGILICLYIDHHYGFNGWSITWVAPFAILGLFITTLMIGWLSKLRFEDGILYLFFDVICSLLQLIAIAKGINTFPYPTVLTAAVLIIALLGLLIFRFRDVKSASGKWFNM